MSQNHNHILHIGSHSQEEPAEEIALATPIASATPALEIVLEIGLLMLIWRLLRSSSNRNCSATATQEIDTAPEIDAAHTLMLIWRLHSSRNGSSSSAPPEIGHPEIEAPLAIEEPPLAPAPPEIEGANDFVLVVQKSLTQSDVNKDRLTLPTRQSNYNFLSENEIAYLDAHGFLEVVLQTINPHGTKNMLIKLHRDGGSSNRLTRVLTSGWRDYVNQRNHPLSTFFEHFNFYFGWVSSLNLIAYAFQLPPESVLRCGIQHL